MDGARQDSADGEPLSARYDRASRHQWEATNDRKVAVSEAKSTEILLKIKTVRFQITIEAVGKHVQQWEATIIDLEVENHGSLFLLRPRSEMGRFWLEDHIPKDAMPFADKVNGPAVIVERRYMGIVSDAIAEGLNIEQLRWIDGD